jgi:hypothetical protein
MLAFTSVYEIQIIETSRYKGINTSCYIVSYGFRRDGVHNKCNKTFKFVQVDNSLSSKRKNCILAQLGHFLLRSNDQH